MHQVGQSLPLHHAFVLEANKEVIAERERPLLDTGKPANEVRAVERLCSRVSTGSTAFGALIRMPPRAASTGTREAGTAAPVI